ncbi:hypothetical protein CRUP_008355 [Coryphaenoides rupestris]|nr:hypothetical protein CRUP_008355 [Coryphaenoides rupestris]
MTWTGAAGYCIVVLVFLCCLDLSLQGCADYAEGIWEKPLPDHYIQLQRLLPNQTLEDVVKDTLINWCCKSMRSDDSIRGLDTNLSTGIQSVLCFLLISSNAAWFLYFWRRRGQQRRWNSTANDLRKEDIPHSQVLLEERPHREGHA